MSTPVIAQELGLIKGIKIFGKPQVSVVAFGSDETNVFGISDTLKNKVFILTLITGLFFQHFLLNSRPNKLKVFTKLNDSWLNSNKFLSKLKIFQDFLNKKARIFSLNLRNFLLNSRDL